MSVRQAATQLMKTLAHHDWFMSVGIGEANGREAIYVFLRRSTSSPELKQLKENGWSGFPVVVVKTGSPKLA